jgi:hypothetical protein
MLYVGKQVTAQEKDTQLREFQCRACRYTGEAVVVGVGQGTGNSAYFLDNQGARERAGVQAARAAEANVELTLSLAKCPRCGNRDEAAVRWFWLRLGAIMAGMSLFIWGIGGLVALIQGEMDPVLLWIFGPIGLVMPVAAWWTEGWKLETVDQRVLFIEPPKGPF